MNNDEIKELARKLKGEMDAFSLGKLIIFLGVGSEVDNYGQVVIYTGLKHGDNGQYEVMTDEDFQEKEEAQEEEPDVCPLVEFKDEPTQE